MSHTPPLPEAATPPWPATPEPADKAEATPVPAAEKTETSKMSAKTIAGVGAAIGIGSAAIVAALLYTNRNQKSTKKR